MRVISLELAEFRNYAALRFVPPEGACVLVGQNAQGKSNLLESLGLLATGKSFRGARDVDLIAVGAPAASVSARAQTRAGESQVSCLITRAGEGARKRFMRGPRTVSYAQFLGGIAAVTFVPSDLQLVTGPASLRRRMLNAALSQASRAYYRDLAAYSKVVTQKNAFLRSPEAADRALLLTYNEQLVKFGGAIVAARAAYVRKLNAEAGAAHARWLGAREGLELVYAPQPEQREETAPAMEARLRDELAAGAGLELARRLSLFGPHRDDVVILLGGKPLSRFGSQGQQRTAVLALKAAEYALLRQSAGEAPLLLLDDVLSELDAERRQAFLSSLRGFEQAFITTTDLSDVASEFGASVFEIRAGAVREQAERASA